MEKSIKIGLGLAAGAMALLPAQRAEATAVLSQDLFDITIDSNQKVDNSYLLYKEEGGGSIFDQKVIKDEVPTGSNSFTFIGPAADASNPYLFIGEYLTVQADGSVRKGIFVTADGSVAKPLIGNTDATFESAFGNAASLSEADLIRALDGGDLTTLDKLFNSAATGVQFGASETLVDFSAPTDGGTASVTAAPVPEPSGLASVAAGLLALFGLSFGRRGRRRLPTA
ncbi:MAG: hypothetical protein ACHQC9_03700 [Alphaproteobacteria bacterium]